MNSQLMTYLGGSIVREEHKGDFVSARSFAEVELERVRGQGDRFALADALLDRGIVHLLQDELGRARQCFVEIKQLAENDSNRLLRALSYDLLTIYEQFNSFPNGAGAGATEIGARWKGAEDLLPYDQQWQILFQQVKDQSVQFEAWLIYNFLCNLKPSQYMLELNRYSPSGLTTEQMLQTFLNNPTRVQQFGEANKLPGLAAVGSWFAADLCHRAGQTVWADQFLQHAKNGYELANDLVGCANCLVTEADWLCAPFSTPVMWNFALQDSSSEASHLSTSQEADEFRQPSAEAAAQAVALYTQAEKIYEQAGADRGIAEVRLRYGYLAITREDYARAMEEARRAADVFERVGDLRQIRLAQTHVILAAVGLGQTTQIEEQARTVGAEGAIHSSFSDTLGLGILLNRFARHWLIREGDYERALACYRAARALFTALGAHINATQNRVDQGLVYQAIGERSTAVTFYEEALEGYGQLVQTYPLVADNLRQRALMLTTNLYQTYLQNTDADGMEHSAARLKLQLSTLPGSVETGEWLQSMVTGLSSAVAAEGGLDQMLALGPDFWALRNLAQSFIEQASVLVPLYRARKAKEKGDRLHAAQWLADAESALPGVNEAQRSLLEIAVHAEQEQWEAAAQVVRKYLQAGGANVGFTGKLTELMESFGGKHGHLEAQIQKRRTHEQAFSMFVRVKAYAEAKTQLDQVEALAGAEWWKEDRRPWQSLSDCAEMYEGLGELDTALNYYEQSIAELEGRRAQLSRDELKTALAADKGVQYLYFFAARVAMKKKEYAHAFALAERGKARGLLDLMAGSAASVGGSMKEDTAMMEWRQLSAQLTLRRGLLAQEWLKSDPSKECIQLLTQQLEMDEVRMKQIEIELTSVLPNFGQVVSTEAFTLSVEQVATALPEDTALIEFVFLDNDLLLWTIDRKGLKQAESISLDTLKLAQDIRAFHYACETARNIEPSGIAAELAKAFLEPIAPTIHEHEHLIMVPYGTAHLLPFHALFFDGGPLIAKHTIRYLPSASVLQFLAAPQMARRPTILAVGDPTGNLVNATIEAQFVASLFGEKALIGLQATKEAVRPLISKHTLLHFATHGNLNEEAPLASSVSLANGEELTVYELMGLRLDADLVVLSACNTGQGQATGGDDVLGLTRGLLGTGARAAVVSLWRVDDESTSLLMGEFYRQLRQGESAWAALASAQNYLQHLSETEAEDELAKLRHAIADKGNRVENPPLEIAASERHISDYELPATVGYSHPYHWAAFILVG